MKLESLTENAVDRLNPVLLKEIRQLFHSKTFYVLVSLLLAGELIATFISWNECMEHNFSNHVLRDVASGFAVFEYVALSLLLLCLCGCRSCSIFNKERMNRDLDYSRLSALSAYQIVTGKFLSNGAIMLLVLSITLPFMIMSYFLGGVDIGDMLLVVGFIGIGGVFANLLSLIVGSCGRKGFEGLFILLFFVLGIVLTSVSLARIYKGGHAGLGLERTVLLLFFCLLACFLFMFSVAAVDNSRGNVMFIPKLSAGILFLAVFMMGPLGKLAELVPPVRSGIISVLNCIGSAGMLVLMIILPLLCIIAHFERETPGQRLMDERSASRWKRIAGSILVTGRYNSFAFLWIVAFIWLSVCFVLPAAWLQLRFSFISFSMRMQLSLYSACSAATNILPPLPCCLFSSFRRFSSGASPHCSAALLWKMNAWSLRL